MEQITLDLKERLFLANQYKILAAVYPDEADSYSQARTVIEEGYEIAYLWYAQQINPSPLGTESCAEVLEILSMFDDLQYGYCQLSDKSTVDEHEVKFPGFDGNNETNQLGFFRFLVEDQGKFASLRNSGDNLNSHAPLLEVYRRMLPVWKSFKLKTPLELSDIQKIIAERIHPQNRSTV